MTLDRSEAGRASTFDDVTSLFDEPSVRGNGELRIDEDSDPSRFAWYPIESQSSKPNSSERLLGRIGLSSGNYPPFPLDTGNQRVNESLKEYDSRLTYLRHEAAQDGYELNLASESDFKEFVRSSVDLHRGQLVLLDNGNLRMIWKDGKGTQLGLQFLGGRAIQFVIFKHRKEAEQITRVTGRDSLTGLMSLIGAFDLQSLLFT